KFDNTGDLNTIEGTYRAIMIMRDSLGERFDYVNPPSQAAAEKQEIHSDLVGIGIPVGLNDLKGIKNDLPKRPTKDQVESALKIRAGHELMIVADPFEGGPAYGVLKKGDIITAVDGHKLDGLSLEDASALIRGKAGTKVDVTVQRTQNGEVTTPTFTFTRAAIV